MIEDGNGIDSIKTFFSTSFSAAKIRYESLKINKPLNAVSTQRLTN